MNGINLLERLYSDPKRWTFLFQNYVQLSRLELWMQIGEAPVTLVERSIHSNRFVYLETGRQRGNLSKDEFEVLVKK